MSAAKGGEEIVERDIVRQVRHRKSQGNPLAVARRVQTVGTETEIEQVPRSNASRIGVVIFRTLSRYPHAGRAEIRVAGTDAVIWCRHLIAAEKADRRLLCWR